MGQVLSRSPHGIRDPLDLPRKSTDQSSVLLRPWGHCLPSRREPVPRSRVGAKGEVLAVQGFQGPRCGLWSLGCGVRVSSGPEGWLAKGEGIPGQNCTSKEREVEMSKLSTTSVLLHGNSVI